MTTKQSDMFDAMMVKYDGLVSQYTQQSTSLDREINTVEELAYCKLRIEALENQVSILHEQLWLLMQFPSMLNIHRSRELSKAEDEVRKQRRDIEQTVRTVEENADELSRCLKHIYSLMSQKP